MIKEAVRGAHATEVNGHAQYISAEDIKINLKELSEQANGLEQKVRTGQQLLENPVESIPCLVEPVLQSVGLACLAGSSDTGKSTILRQLAIAVASNNPKFLGWDINAKHNKALVVCTEDGEDAVSFLLTKQAKDMPPSSLSGLRFMFDFENLLDELDDQLDDQPVDLVVIDCFADVFGDNLNDTHKLRAKLNEYNKLSRKHKCLILFLHHTGKRTENLEPSKNNLLGGQGFEAKMRVVLELRIDPHDYELRHLCVVKGNYLPNDYKQDSFVLEQDKDTMNFKLTGQRAPFERLVKRKDKTTEKEDRYEQITDWLSQGKSKKEIAQFYTYSDASGLTNWIKRYEERKNIPPEKSLLDKLDKRQVPSSETKKTQSKST